MLGNKLYPFVFNKKLQLNKNIKQLPIMQVKLLRTQSVRKASLASAPLRPR